MRLRKKKPEFVNDEHRNLYNLTFKLIIEDTLYLLSVICLICLIIYTSYSIFVKTIMGITIILLQVIKEKNAIEININLKKLSQFKFEIKDKN